MPKIASSCRERQKESPTTAATAKPMRAATCTPCDRAIRISGAEVLAGDRGSRAHQPDRRPRDQREQLGVADRVGRLRRGALLQRSDEAQHQHAGDVHRDPLYAGRKAEAEQRSNDRPVGRRSHAARELDDRLPLQQLPQRRTTDTIVLLAIASRRPAPTVPRPRIRITLKATFNTVIAMPSRIGVRGSPAARNAPLSMKNIIMPKMTTNIVRRNGRASALTSGAALTRSSSARRRRVADRRHQRRAPDGGEERLIHDAIDLVRLVRRRRSARRARAMPVNSELMKTMTTRMICQLTPIAALAVIADEVADHAWSMIPCRPAMTFCSIVGHARRQTAGPMGPSTIERSNFWVFGSGPDIRSAVDRLSA